MIDHHVIRIAVAMSYYGISFSSANLSGDFHINFELLM